MTNYSQNNEQQYILEYFNSLNNGKYLEIGGYNPFTFSNTRALFEKGWSGVIVEPSTPCYESFEKEYPKDKFPQITLLKCAITNYTGKIKFYDSQGDAISSTSIEHKEKWEAGYRVKYNEIEVDCMSMNDLLENYGKDIDFLNLDVESTNISLFNLIPDWFWQRCKMLCIEHDCYQDYIVNKLSPFGFREIHRNGENIILLK